MKKVFKLPKTSTIKGRSSIITNAFANAIIPRVTPKDEEVKKILDIFGMTKENIRCVYCGEEHTEWDHFNPVVDNKGPTGFTTTISNLVPCCGKCNESKGNKNWKNWISSVTAESAPVNRISAEQLKINIQKLELYESTITTEKINFSDILEQEIWDDYWNLCDEIQKKLNEAQIKAIKIKQILESQQSNLVKKSNAHI